MQTQVALVDDDLSVRRALQRLLVAAGFSVRVFASGQELLDSTLPEDASCFLLDVHLPGMSGFEIHDALRERGVQSPVVFMTAHHTETTIERARAAGARYLRKPFDSQELLGALSAALDTATSNGMPS
jgi:FixJ family two-component response regulator